MSRTRRVARNCRNQQRKTGHVDNDRVFREMIEVVLPEGELFSKGEFHGNIKWVPEQLAAQALIWSWQDSKNVTDAFGKTLEVCKRIGLSKGARNYTGFMDALSRYRGTIGERLRRRHQELAPQIGGRFFRTDDWLLIGFDGSRATAPRTIANEEAFCAPNYGFGKEALYGKKKSKGLRRKRNKAHKPELPEPQVWITMMWHMGLRLPWTWRLGPSNSSERGHVQEILEQETFPKKTLFCGDAGFVGYPLWSSIIKAGADFLIRVGANVNLLSEQVNFQKVGGGIVLCWPKDKIKADQPPLKLRLVQVKVGKTKMWMLTSVLDRQKLTNKQIVRYYKMRWGIEVEFRGLKQILDKHKLRCRNDDRLLAELDWALRGMATAELLALRHQILAKPKKSANYTPRDLSLANTLRVLRKCMRNLGRKVEPTEDLIYQLKKATVQRYFNHTDKRARYRPKNPDVKPLGDPVVRKPTAEERRKLREFSRKIIT
jgi:Transposase DDE domain